MLDGIGYGLSAVGGIGFGEDIAYMVRDRVATDAQRRSDVTITLTSHEQVQHLDLALGQATGIGRLCTESFANSPAYFSGSFRSLKYQGVRGTHLGAKMNSRKRSYTTTLMTVAELTRKTRTISRTPLP